MELPKKAIELAEDAAWKDLAPQGHVYDESDSVSRTVAVILKAGAPYIAAAAVEEASTRLFDSLLRHNRMKAQKWTELYDTTAFFDIGNDFKQDLQEIAKEIVEEGYE